MRRSDSLRGLALGILKEGLGVEIIDIDEGGKEEASPEGTSGAGERGSWCVAKLSSSAGMPESRFSTLNPLPEPMNTP